MGTSPGGMGHGGSWKLPALVRGLEGWQWWVPEAALVCPLLGEGKEVLAWPLKFDIQCPQRAISAAFPGINTPEMLHHAALLPAGAPSAAFPSVVTLNLK